MDRERFEKFMAENFVGISLAGYRQVGGIWVYKSPVTQSYWNVWKEALRCK